MITRTYLHYTRPFLGRFAQAERVKKILKAQFCSILEGVRGKVEGIMCCNVVLFNGPGVAVAVLQTPW